MKNIGFAIVLTCAASSVAVAAEGDHSPRLLGLARLIDQVPTSEHVRAAAMPEGSNGSQRDALRALDGVIHDASLDRYTRARSMGFVGFFSGADAEAVALRVARDAAFDLEVRIVAVGALRHVVGAAGLYRFEPLLQDAEVGVRAAAVRAVAHFPEGRAMLQARQNQERDPSVRALIARKLRN